MVSFSGMSSRRGFSLRLPEHDTANISAIIVIAIAEIIMKPFLMARPFKLFTPRGFDQSHFLQIIIANDLSDFNVKMTTLIVF